MPDITPTVNPLQPAEPARPPRRWFRTLLLGVLVICALGASAAWLLQSRWFYESARRRLVEAIETTTGARVELQAFAFSPFLLEAQLIGLTLHGREGPQEPPLFSAERIEAQWKLTSVWGLRADWRQLRVWNPRIYIAVDDAGNTNLPVLPVERRDGSRWLRRVFDLQVRSLEVLRGEFRWNQRGTDHSRPFDLHAEDFLAQLDYEAEARRFSGKLDSQNTLFSFGTTAPLPSRTRLNFSFFPDHAVIESLEWNTAQSRAQVQGAIADYRSPKIDLRYDIQLHLADAGKLLAQRGWDGEMHWRGQGDNRGPGWRLEGDVEVRTGRSGIPQLRGVPWSAAGALRVTESAPPENPSESSVWYAELEKLDIAALGGRLRGSGRVDFVAARPATRLTLEAQRLSLPAALDAISTPSLPLERLHWSGTVSGPVEATFSGLGENLKVTAEWEISAPPVTPPGFLPASGRLSGSYGAAARRIEVRGGSIELPQTRLTADGWITQQDSHLSVGVTTAQLDSTQSLREMLNPKYRILPLRLYGLATGDLLWIGGTQQPEFDGPFTVTDFSYRDIRWNELSGMLHYRSRFPKSAPQAKFPSAVGAVSEAEFSELVIESGRLTRNRAAAAFNLRVGLEEGLQLTARSPFALQAQLRDGDAGEMRQVLGMRYPVEGKLQATINASGTRENPRGGATLTLTDGTVYEEPFDRLTAELLLEPGGTLSVSNARFEKANAAVLADGSFNRATRAVRFHLTSSNFPLQDIRWLETQRLPIAGLAQIQLSGSGTLDSPQLQGEIQLRDLAMGAERVGDLSVAVDTTQDERAQFRGNATFFGAPVQLFADVRMAGAFPATARVSFEDLDIPKVLRLRRALPEDFQAQAGGVAIVEGPLRQPKQLRVRGEIARLDAALGTVAFESVAPLRLEYADGSLRIEPAHFRGPNLDLETAGTVRLQGRPELNLTAKGRADLAALQVFYPQLSSSGQVVLDASLNGTLERPLWRGRLEFAGGNLRYGDLPNGLADVRGTVLFDGNRALLQNVTAESGGGLLRVGGFFAYEQQTGWQLQLTGDAESVRVRYPQGISTVLDGRLTWGGSAQDSLLAGRLIIRREAVNANFDLATALLQPRQDTGLPPRSAFVRNMRLDLTVVSAPDIRLETTAARNLQGDVDLRIQGTVEHPAWLGRIGILGGELYFAGKKYTVNRGEIAFTNPFRFEPILKLNVQSRVQQYDISMDFSGPPDRLTVTYHSDPPLPTGDILALLVAGSSRQPLSDVSPMQPVPQIGAESLLGQALSAQIGNRLDRIFGTGRIRVDPQLAGFNRPANASVAFEQQIKDNLTITYVTNVTSVRQQFIQGEWAVSPRFSVIAIRDQNGLIGVNLQMSLRFR